MGISPLAMWTPGIWEMVIILVVVLLLFGRRLPEVMRSLGRGLTEFKRGMHEPVDDIKREIESPPPTPEGKAKKTDGNKSGG